MELCMLVLSVCRWVLGVVMSFKLEYVIIGFIYWKNYWDFKVEDVLEVWGYYENDGGEKWLRMKKGWELFIIDS